MFRKIATYSASIYAVTVAASAVSFLVTMVIARRIPKEALGQYGFYVTVYSFVGMLLCSGLNQSLVKFLGDKKEDRRELDRLLLAVVALLAVVSWPCAIVARAMHLTSTSWGLFALPFSILYLLGASRFRTDFAKTKEMALRISVSLLNSTLTLGFAFLGGNAVMAPIRGDFLSMAIPGVVLIALFATGAGLRHPRLLVSTLRGPTARRLFRFSIPLAIAGAAFVTYSNAASLLIRGLIGLAALGEFYFAVQLMQILEKPMQILSNVILAAFAQDPTIAPDKHKRLVTFNLAVFPLIAAGVAYGAPLMLAVADHLMKRVGGDPLSVKYALAPLYVSLFALAVPGRCVEFLVSTLAIARGWPQINRNTHVLTTSVALPILAGMVWYFGPWGAAAMPLVYETVFLSLQAWQLHRRMPEIIAHTTRAALIATILLAAVLALGRLPGAIFFYPLAALGYLAGGHFLGAWDLRTLRPGRATRAPAPVIDAAAPSRA